MEILEFRSVEELKSGDLNGTGRVRVTADLDVNLSLVVVIRVTVLHK